MAFPTCLGVSQPHRVRLARFGRELGTLSNLDIRPIWRYALYEEPISPWSNVTQIQKGSVESRPKPDLVQPGRNR